MFRAHMLEHVNNIIVVQTIDPQNGLKENYELTCIYFTKHIMYELLEVFQDKFKWA